MSKEVKESPLISVITVVFNSKNDLDQTLQNIISQNYSSFEIIVIDGCSTDGTVNILERYRDKVDTIVIESDEGYYSGLK